MTRCFPILTLRPKYSFPRLPWASCSSEPRSPAVERFASGRAIVSADLDVAREYGRLKQYLKKKGRPLPENDISIAAAAKCHEMVLVTRDLREIVCTPQIGPFIRDVCLNSVQPVAQIPTLVSARLPPNLGVFLQ